MSLKKGELSNINPSVETRNLDEVTARTGNLYESLAVISKRANQINSQIKEELHGKLGEFASSSDNLEEVFENREQIEISRYYEKLPNPCLIATEEFLKGELFARRLDTQPQ
jgi:DNA-directed RNA polymerase subunit K/omega